MGSDYGSEVDPMGLPKISLAPRIGIGGVVKKACQLAGRDT